MPTGRLPILSQAVHLASSEEFTFDKKPHKPMTVSQPGGSQSTQTAEKIEGGPVSSVHRRQKIKRKRFRVVFYVRASFRCILIFILMGLR